MGIMGAVALSLLMIPTVVRNSEEMLRLVPMDLREAAYALGVPKWLTIVKVVLRTAIAGLTTGITLAIARVIGETAPLLLTVGMVTSVNWNMFDGRMATLPTFINQQYRNGNANCMSDTVTNPVNQEVYACSISTNIDRAWAAAFTLIVIVMILNVIARLISHYFSPKLSR
jgi:phosphate transport system permease protein